MPTKKRSTPRRCAAYPGDRFDRTKPAPIVTEAESICEVLRDGTRSKKILELTYRRELVTCRSCTSAIATHPQLMGRMRDALQPELPGLASA